MKTSTFLQFKNRNDWIDILRGLSIILVLVTHGSINLSFFGFDQILPKRNFDILRSNGYLGVSMFFTISGFLISKQLLSRLEKRQKKSQIFSKREYLQSFYLKRLGRIIPPLLFLFILGFILNLLTNNAFKDFQVEPLTLFFLAFVHALSFTYNYFYLGEGGSVTGLRPYIPLWSLSIEEIFYFFYPIILKYLFRSRKSLLVFLILLVIVSPIYRYNNGIVSLYHLFGCFDMLAFGALAFTLPKYRPLHNLAKPFFRVVILLLLFISLTCVDIHEDFVLAPSLIGFLSFLYLVCSESQNHSIVKKQVRYFSFFIRLFGVLSYEIYLFHLMFLILFWRLDHDNGSDYLSTPVPLVALVLFSLICHVKIFEPIRAHIVRKFIH